ncbi:MAG: phosphoserine phosphatase SerB [Candidatus Hecatellales archaeon]|nr:MAG: phosphoserine phosphatase SerB [Candidatus Hecatellales archaeon]
MGNIIVTSIGRDRPGIVAGISNILYQHNANILKTRASILGGLFVMVMVVDVSKINLKLEELVSKLKEKGIELGSGISVEDEKVYRRKKKLIAFDLDGTLIKMETLDELAKAAGVYDEVKKITRMAMEGKIGFREALKKRVKLLKNLPVEEVEKLKERIEFNVGVQDLVKELKKAGFVTAIITGGFDVFANYVAEKLGIDYVYANRLIVRKGVLTGEFEGKIVSARSKLKALAEIAKKEGISLSECVAVGDGANDIFILKSSGLGIGYKPKKVVENHAKALVNSEDLRTIMAFIGGGQIRKDVIRKLKRR